MVRKGRDLERLVLILERGLASKDVVIKSPDFVVDTVSNENREVDVSIRQDIGEGEIMTIVECRDRKATEDVTWIEQLVTKVKDVGASRVIAVSSSGFSKGAQSKAEHYGVELRTIDEISNENLENWVIPSSLITIVGHHLIAGMTLLSDNPIFKNAKIPFDPNARCFEHENGNLFSPNDLFNRIPNLSSHYPPDNEHTHKKETFTINLRDTKLFFRLDSNLVKVDGLVLEVELWNQIQEIPNMRMFTYSNKKERLVGGSTFPVTLEGRKFHMITHTTRTENEQTVKFTLQREKEQK